VAERFIRSLGFTIPCSARVSVTCVLGAGRATGPKAHGAAEPRGLGDEKPASGKELYKLQPQRPACPPRSRSWVARNEFMSSAIFSIFPFEKLLLLILDPTVGHELSWRPRWVAWRHRRSHRWVVMWQPVTSRWT
jgi:hypothetical protein